jgi:S-adenosylmethionine/arginine decarboxylase-like enzyme
VTDERLLRTFLKAVVKKIDMVSHGDPLMSYFPEDKPELIGWSIIQLIETSSITCHCMEKSRDASYIDIFSCKPFDPQAALGVIEDFFAPEEIQAHFVDRGKWDEGVES